MSSPALADVASPDAGDAPLVDLARRVGHDFADLGLLELALRHRSWCAENGNLESNERLEFLGDSVLGLVITDHLYESGPDLPEGVMARRRAELVNARVLAEVARDVFLGPAVLLGRGEEATGGRAKPSILADTMEAVIGAVYLDGGLDSAQLVVMELFTAQLREVASGGPGTDFKSRLQEIVARRFDETPTYRVEETGPDHAKWFEATVTVGTDVLGSGGGRSKKQAEQAAAAHAWRLLGERPPTGIGLDDADPKENGA